ncbi:putative starch synthase 4, chloroplastic/amyloplastic [Sesamum alatum]|uniref:starch synthase n=1 Tax=Sesamum alatum TaxID=300844 RepID=A0AAE2CZU2_9LAMI|nr:putative starch synthase 4, chloroplastic/amyloplastic [Sesamum alatum]
MEATPSTCFVGRGFGGGGLRRSQVTVRFYRSTSYRLLLPAYCRMRQRNFSLQNKRQNSKKISSERPKNSNLRPNGDGNSDPVNLSKHGILHSNREIASNERIPIIIEAYSNRLDYDNSSPPLEVRSLPNDDVDSAGESSHSDDGNMGGSSFPSNDITSPSTNIDEGEQLQGIHLQDLVGMIRDAEKNIHLLNQARVRALKDLEKIFDEKEELQGEMNILEMKLAETDARLKVAAQEKVHVELLEDQLEKLRDELSSRGNSEDYLQEMNTAVSSSQVNLVNSFSQDVDLLRAENMSLKDELQVLKAEFSNIRESHQRVQMLEEERSVLESSLKELELKLAASHEDVSEISSLKSECKSLYKKVEDLQTMLDKATKQADQAILVVQQNQELRKKVDRLEESLNEANTNQLSSQKMQQYNELMQQKIKLLDARLQRSDEEIQSYVQLYQDSMKDFHDTISNLKEENKKKAKGESVLDKPPGFWSNLLLMVDGWFLEKKISVGEAKVLRKMIWNREASICDAYISSKGKIEREIIATFLKQTSSTRGTRLHVIHIAAEMAPVCKVYLVVKCDVMIQGYEKSVSSYSFGDPIEVGGLGDVVTGLSKALQKKGHLVEIVLPKYDSMRYDLIQDLKVLDAPIESYFDGRLFKNRIWVGTVEGLPVYFIEPHHPSKFFWRGQLYGEVDDFKRFSFFSRAALELLLQAGKKPDIIHCHDWQTAFVAPLYWDLYVPKGLDSARICFTCHNFEYQGAAPASDLASCGLDVYRQNKPDRMQDNSANDRVNSVKGAIVFSNIVTTVSPSYAQEVRTAEGGRGLQATLNSHSKKFVGILNGIDTDAWNPATDPLVKVQYNSNDIEGKAENKEALRSLLGMSSANVRQPLKEFEDICSQFKTHEHARLILKYDESLAHLIYAASDMFIIPSIFEPCGLTQMIAMRYGSIPIARKTGGLNDSVFDVDDDNIPIQYRNGFTFLKADEQGLNSALERAFYHYKNDPEGWKQLVLKDMNIDFSWDSSASVYEDLYQKSVVRARAANRP